MPYFDLDAVRKWALGLTAAEIAGAGAAATRPARRPDVMTTLAYILMLLPILKRVIW